MRSSRRDFLGALLAAGFTGGCRLFDVDAPVAASEALDGNLILSRVAVEVGVKSPFSVLHVSDTHLNFMDRLDQSAEVSAMHFKRRWTRFPQAYNSMVSTLAYAERRGIPILHTGDLIDYGSNANYEILRRHVAGRGDFHYAIGNHEYHYRSSEDLPNDRENARQRLARHMPNDVEFSSRVIGGVNFVAFDNADRNVTEGVARNVLSEFGRGLPVVLMCHVPICRSEEIVANKKAIVERCGALYTPESAVMPDDEAVGPRLPARDLSEDAKTPVTRDFVARLKREPLLKAVLCGHTHIRYHERFSPTAVMYVGGGNFEGYAREVRFV